MLELELELELGLELEKTVLLVRSAYTVSMKYGCFPASRACRAHHTTCSRPVHQRFDL
jgi:hypothetical protein